jgi:glycosyltransferase involved in cell wall biosynthesis
MPTSRFTIRSPQGTRPARVAIVVSVDWFFVSHRLPIARALRAAGAEIVIAAHETECRPILEGEGFRFVGLPLARGSKDPRTEVSAIGAIASLYRDFRPDVVHQVSIKPILYGSMVARALGIRRVINAVSGLGYAFIERPDDGLRDRMLRPALRRAYGFAFTGERTRVIFQNDDDAGAFTRAGLVPREHIRMIRGSGVDVAKFTPSELPEGAPIVLLPARALRDKGVVEFVTAARVLRARGMRDVRFVLCGRLDEANPAGIPGEEVRRWVSEGVLEWWGSLPHTEMPAALSRASLVVLPSYREGLPLVLAEAGASARACVATDVPGCRDVVREGDNGWLVPVRDAGALASAIERALGDRDELARRGRRGREIAEREFALDSVLASTLSIYDELLAT